MLEWTKYKKYKLISSFWINILDIFIHTYGVLSARGIAIIMYGKQKEIDRVENALFKMQKQGLIYRSDKTQTDKDEPVFGITEKGKKVASAAWALHNYMEESA